MAKIQFDTQFKTPYITSYGEKQQKKNTSQMHDKFRKKLVNCLTVTRAKH